MPGWKTAQTKKRKGEKVKLALVALGLILGLIFLSQVFKFTHMLFSPLSQAEKTYRWDGDFNINVLLRSDTISLLTLNPSEQKITIIKIPDQTYLDVSGGKGKWQLRSIYGLGGDELLKDSLTNFFGIPIDGFLSPADFNLLNDKNPLSLLNILPSIKTDLTPLELLKLKLSISKVRFDKKVEVDLEEIELLNKINLADGTEVFSADPFKLDSLSSYFADPIIKNEHKTIAIFNSTNHPGLAQKAARILTNIGADVIILSNGKLKLEKTVVAGEESKTLERIRQIFDASGTIEPKVEDLASSRAQINIFLGEDFIKKL